MKRNLLPLFSLIILFSFLLGSCGEKEDPLERERREVDEQLKSIKVSLYKGIKVALRALPVSEMDKADNSAASKMAVAHDADAVMEAEHTYVLAYDLLHRLDPEDTTETGWGITDYIQVVAEIYQLEKSLETINEDDFPTILENISGIYNGEDDPTALLWYNSSYEHAILAALLLASQKAPRDLILYEAHMLRPQEIELPPLKLVSYAVRSAIYLMSDYNYISEYEATQYLNALKTYREAIVKAFPAEMYPDVIVETEEQMYAQIHMIGVLERGIARFRIGKEDEAVDDLDLFLKDAETIGLESEIVWLVGAYVNIYRERNDEALMYLAKLKNSPLMGDKERKLIGQIEGYIAERDPEAALNLLFDKVFIGRIVVEIVFTYASEVDWYGEIESTESGKYMIDLSGEVVDEYNELTQYLSLEELKEQGGKALEEGGKALEEGGKALKEEGKEVLKDVKKLWK